MLTNLSNHPVSSWPDEQYQYAFSRWGEVLDVPFPSVPPASDEADIMCRVRKYLELLPGKEAGPVFVSGEYSFTYAMADLLMKRGYRVMYAESENTLTLTTLEDGSTERRMAYRFIRFRDYRRLPEELERETAFEPVFLNGSFHYPSSGWDEEALKQASVYGRIEDLPIAPFQGTDEEQSALARGFLGKIDALRPSAVLLDGAFGTFYIMADALVRRGYTVLVKCSQRIAAEEKGQDGVHMKTSQYRFVRYRRVLPYAEETCGPEE